MVSHLLTAGSALWLVLVTLIPACQEQIGFLAGTALWLATGSVVSLVVLFRKKRLLFVLNIAQVLLFALFFAQIFKVFGPHHFQATEEPFLFDWQLFAWSQALHAADLLHVLKSYGMDLNLIEHKTTLAGVALWIMHVNVGLFVIGLLVRWLRTEVQRWQRPSTLEHRRAWRLCFQRWFAAALVVVAVCVTLTAAVSRWHWRDWLLWPLANVLRTLDLGDAIDIFDWRIDSVPRGWWTGTLGLLFRVLVGILLLRWLRTLELHYLGAKSPRPLCDFIDDLHHADEPTREAAAYALAAIGPAAGGAVVALVEALEDESGPVGTATRQALLLVGAPPPGAVVELMAQLRNPNWALRRAAADALQRIGPPALPAIAALVEKLADDDPTMPAHAEQALLAIYPGWETGSLARGAIVELIARLRHAQRRIREKAAQTLGRLGPGARAAIPALLGALEDEEEYVRLSAQWALDAIDPGWVDIHKLPRLTEYVSA